MYNIFIRFSARSTMQQCGFNTCGAIQTASVSSTTPLQSATQATALSAPHLHLAQRMNPARQRPSPHHRPPCRPVLPPFGRGAETRPRAPCWSSRSNPVAACLARAGTPLNQQPRQTHQAAAAAAAAHLHPGLLLLQLLLRPVASSAWRLMPARRRCWPHLQIAAVAVAAAVVVWNTLVRASLVVL